VIDLARVERVKERARLPDRKLAMSRAWKMARTEASHLWRIWSYRAIWLGLLAVVIGGYGQSLLRLEVERVQGVALIVASMVLAVIAWSGIRDAPFLIPRPKGVGKFITWRSELVRRLVGIAGALALLWWSHAAWWANPNEFFGLQGVLWLASMVLLIVSCSGWYSKGTDAEALETPWTRIEIVVFVGIVTLTLVTRLSWLGQIPWRVDPNEFIAFGDSLHYYRDPPTMSMFTTTWMGTSMPSLWLTFEGWLMRWMGTDLAGVRAWSALMGALTVVPIYGLARLAWGRIAAVLASFGFIFTAVSIHYSRTSFPNTGTPLGWACSFYFLLRGLRSRRPLDFALSGVVAGLSLYTHHSSRLLPYLLVAFTGYMLVFHFKDFRTRIGHFALVVVGFVIGFGPLLAYFGLNPKMWAGRGMDHLLIPPVVPTTWDAIVADWLIISAELWQNFLSLTVVSARDTFYFAPFMLPAQAVLLMMGLGVLVWRWRQPASFLFLLWGLSVIFVISLISVPGNENPNFAHWAAAFPVFFLALGLPPALLLKALKQKRVNRRWWAAGSLLVAGWMAWTITANAHFYLVTYPPMQPTDQSMFAVQGRFLEQVEPDTLVRYIGNGWQNLNTEIALMVAPHTTAGQMFNPSRQLPLEGSQTYNQGFTFFSDQLHYLPLFQAYYPGGETKPISAPNGTQVGSIYEVSAEHVDEQYGVYATFAAASQSGTIVWRGRVPTIGAMPEDITLTYPMTATWSGALYVLTPGQLQFNVQGTESASVWTLGRPDALSVPVQADIGWMPFQVQAQLTGPEEVRLLVQQTEKGVAAEIEKRHLWPSDPNAGIAVAFGGLPQTRRVDPFVGSTLLRPSEYYRPGNLPIPLVSQLYRPLPLMTQEMGGNGIIRWKGEIFVEGGMYNMELRTDARAQLFIDGVIVVNLCNPTSNGSGMTAQTSLAAGWHQVQIDFQHVGASGGLEWVWTRPDGIREIVPPARLRYVALPGDEVQWPIAPDTIGCGP